MGVVARCPFGWQEADSESARALLTAFVEGRLEELAQAQAAPVATEPAARGTAGASGLQGDQPCQRRVLAELSADGAAQIDAAVLRAQAAQKKWAR